MSKKSKSSSLGFDFLRYYPYLWKFDNRQEWSWRYIW